MEQAPDSKPFKVDAADSPRWRLLWVPPCVLVGLLFAATLWEFSFPDSHFTIALTLAFLWGVLLLAWTIYAVIKIFRKNYTWRDWLIPVAAAAAVVVAVTSAPFELRFRLSEPSMTSQAEEIIANPMLADSKNRIGGWQAEDVSTFDGGMRFLIPDIGFLDPVGFAYSTKGKPPNTGEDIYYHQSGNWWVWQQSW